MNKWIGPFGRGIWVYHNPETKQTLGAVWKDLGEYYATGPKEPGEELLHAELGIYKALTEAQRVVEGTIPGWETLHLLSLYETEKKTRG